MNKPKTIFDFFVEQERKENLPSKILNDDFQKFTPIKCECYLLAVEKTYKLMSKLQKQGIITNDDLWTYEDALASGLTCFLEYLDQVELAIMIDNNGVVRKEQKDND